MKVISKAILLLALSQCSVANTIYGIENLNTFKALNNKPVYVQMGSFVTHQTAINYQQSLIRKTREHVFIQSSAGKYQVRVGPFNHVESLKKFAQNFSQSNHEVIKNHTPPEKSNITMQNIPFQEINNPLTQTTAITKTPSKWFVNLQVGGQEANFGSSVTVNNGSGLTSPNDLDIYTAPNSDMSTLFGVQTGYRWALSHKWLSAVSLSALYQYYSTSTLNGQVVEFSLPQFTNYNYRWQTSANTILANAKFNFIQYRGFSPYLNGGVGGVFGQTGTYSEQALADVTPRISPNYGSHSDSQFAYVLGAGIDYWLNQELFASLGYQYSDLGTLSSGNGTETWSAEGLNFSHNRSNAFLFGLTYLFDIQLKISKKITQIGLK